MRTLWTRTSMLFLGLRRFVLETRSEEGEGRKPISTFTAPPLIKYFSGALLVGLIALPVQAQQIAELTCQGTFMGVRAVVQGQRQYAPYNSLGDGHVRFSGVLKADSGAAQMMYEGYTRVGAFEGILQGAQGVLPIAVLDNTGGQMIIYRGGASLGAPPIVGQFVCRWR
jgi:hypothetical protein